MSLTQTRRWFLSMASIGRLVSSAVVQQLPSEVFDKLPGGDKPSTGEP